MVLSSVLKGHSCSGQTVRRSKSNRSASGKFLRRVLEAKAGDGDENGAVDWFQELQEIRVQEDLAGAAEEKRAMSRHDRPAEPMWPIPRTPE